MILYIVEILSFSGLQISCISTKILIKSCIKKVVNLMCSTPANFKIKGNSLKFSNNH